MKVLATVVASSALLAVVGHGAGRAADVIVAVPAPMTGAQAAIGRSMQTAAGIVAAEINATGGIGGQTLRVVLHDDTCASGSTTAIAREIASSDAIAIIGHPCAPSALAAAPLYAAAGKLFIAAGSMHAQLSDKRASAWTFRVPALAISQAAFLGRSVTQTAPADAVIAVVGDKTQLNTVAAFGIENTLRAAGRTAIARATFTGGDKDFSALAQRLAAAKVTHVVMLAFAVEGGLMAADLVKAIPTVALYGADVLAAPDFAQVAGLAAEQTRIALQSDPAAYAQQFPRAKVLVERLTAIGAPVHREALYMAAALEAWAHAAQKSTAPADVAEALSLATETLIGPIQFDARGNAKLPLWSLFRWRNGQLVPEAQP